MKDKVINVLFVITLLIGIGGTIAGKVTGYKEGKKTQERVSRLYYNPQDYKIRVGSEDGERLCYTVVFGDTEALDFLTKEQVDSILLGYWDN